MIECPVCLCEVLPANARVLLPCGHTMCAECVAGVRRAARGGRLRCPVCRHAAEESLQLQGEISRTASGRQRFVAQ